MSNKGLVGAATALLACAISQTHAGDVRDALALTESTRKHMDAYLTYQQADNLTPAKIDEFLAFYADDLIATYHTRGFHQMRSKQAYLDFTKELRKQNFNTNYPSWTETLLVLVDGTSAVTRYIGHTRRHDGEIHNQFIHWYRWQDDKIVEFSTFTNPHQSAHNSATNAQFLRDIEMTDWSTPATEIPETVDETVAHTSQQPTDTPAIADDATTSESRRLMNTYLAHVQAGDKRILDYWADDALLFVNNYGPWGGHFKGRTSIAQYYHDMAGMFDLSSGFEFVPLSTVVDGEHAAIYFRIKAQHRLGPYENYYMQVYAWQKGKIVRMENFYGWGPFMEYQRRALETNPLK